MPKPDLRGHQTRCRLLAALHGFQRRGAVPSQYQLARVLGVSQKTVSHQLGRLRATGELGDLPAPGTLSRLSRAKGG